MTIFSQKQIETMCVSIGFNQPAARIASAITMIEAPAPGPPGFCDSETIGDQALATDIWGYSYGFFQIRSLRSATGTGSFRDSDQLLIPEFNCKAAYIIYTQAGGFTSWSTYTSGQYKAYLQDIFPPAPGFYVVLSGDTLTKISVKLKTSWEELARLNNLHAPYTIYIGQTLKLPFNEYTIQTGDTLALIATRFGAGVTWQEIAAFNGIINPNLIYPGQKIRIPVR